MNTPSQGPERPKDRPAPTPARKRPYVRNRTAAIRRLYSLPPAAYWNKTYLHDFVRWTITEGVDRG